MVCYSGHLICVMSHCDVYHKLCYISDIHQGLCHIVIFVKGYVGLWCLSRFTFHYDVIEGYITLRHWAMVCYSGRLISVMSNYNLNNQYNISLSQVTV